MITWELAKDKYKITEYFLEILSTINPRICNSKDKIVKDIWGKK